MVGLVLLLWISLVTFSCRLFNSFLYIFNSALCMYVHIFSYNDVYTDAHTSTGILQYEYVPYRLSNRMLSSDSAM